jgi:hypothetical protein
MKTNEIVIEPHTVVDGQMKSTDIAATAIYNTTVSIINSERTVVWQRYQALLLANSIVFGFMGRGDLSTAYVLIAGVLGLMLCFCWWHLTNDGWRFFDIYSKMAQRFRWPKIDDEANANEAMLKEFQNWKGKSYIFGIFCEGDSIKAASLAVIILFGVGYMLLCC